MLADLGTACAVAFAGGGLTSAALSNWALEESTGTLALLFSASGKPERAAGVDGILCRANSVPDFGPGAALPLIILLFGSCRQWWHPWQEHDKSSPALRSWSLRLSDNRDNR